VARSREIWRDGKLVAAYENGELVSYDREYWERQRSALKAPMIMRDIGEYKSPIDGTVITSRSSHREHMRVHDVIEVGNERMRPAPEPATPARDIGLEIKRRIEEVKALPEPVYQEHVKQQRAEHEAIGALAVPSNPV
jgi:hypothetical protein